MPHGYVNIETHRVMACSTAEIQSHRIVDTMATLVYEHHGLVAEGDIAHIAFVYPRFVCLDLYITANHRGDLSSHRTIVCSGSFKWAITANLVSHLGAACLLHGQMRLLRSHGWFWGRPFHDYSSYVKVYASFFLYTNFGVVIPTAVATHRVVPGCFGCFCTFKGRRLSMSR
ncbi:hypothetical protein DPMN_132600 [Dreissena polymorpha]|uniref:Uncharacterized protein n=1 Tax=Dreissena polymorpha TaxID=45954 RepID=A0A9D4FU54_DREPO|nr:hypothetical protein DPMN_132600 [Dreissena polymorpha]